MRLIMMGCGGFSLEVESYALDQFNVRASAPGSTNNCIAGVCSTDDLRLGDMQTSASVLFSIRNLDEYIPSEDDRFIIAIGDPVVRERIGKDLNDRGLRLATIVHPTAYVAATACIEPGAIISPFSFVGPHARVESHAVLNIYASVGHDAVLGRSSVLSPYATMNGASSLGVACFLGTGASLLPKVSIASYSKVSAGSVANKNAPAGSLLHGNPAQGRVIYQVPEGK